MSTPEPAAQTAAGGSICSPSHAAPGVHNEMCTSEGDVRPHWRYLAEAVDSLGAGELRRRVQEAKRLIRDNDVTYNIYGDPQGMARPWELDLVPLPIGSEEWSSIEAGLTQRAELLNLLLEDLYGARTVFKSGVLPPDLVYSHPGFLHPCAGIRREKRSYLDLYAADLARSPDGRMWVIADRTQAPSGAGYALENRIVLSRILPTLFRDSHVHRLAGFFRSLREHLGGLAPAQRENPRVVVLTPGPDNETYFEHAYLANYLGYTLVEGSDLVVRDGRVWLKMLDVLEPVDVILRRLDDDYCDPLELREDSYLGVPGLLQAARLGSVAIANPLGSGALQNPALTAFMPDLARFFLGRDLSLPMPLTWWCGRAEDRAHVLANLDTLVIKPMRPKPGQRSLFGNELDDAQLEALRSQIERSPGGFVAQEIVPLSSAPVFTEQETFETRHVVLRSFLVAEKDGYRVMPGGLTRVSREPEALLVSSQYGGVSKDTWVLASEPERQDQLVMGAAAVATPIRLEDDVPSRVADDLFWVGRYAERIEGTTRLLRAVHNRMIDQPALREGKDLPHHLQQLLRSITHQTGTYPGFVGAGSAERMEAPEEELLAIIVDGGRTGSLVQALSAFLRAARSVRDRLSNDTWRLINEIDEQQRLLLAGSVTRLGDVGDDLDTLITALVGFAGLASENMIHGQGWRFLEIGRRLERALDTAGLLRNTLAAGGEESEEMLLLEAVLGALDSLMNYRRRYRFGIRMPAVLELLMQDETNPRSIGYQLAQIDSQVAALPGKGRRIQKSEDERLVAQALTQVRLADASLLVQIPEGSALRPGLEGLLSGLTRDLPALSDAITAAYFRHEDQVHQMVRTRPGTSQ